jgi:hypothetical protein
VRENRCRAILSRTRSKNSRFCSETAGLAVPLAAWVAKHGAKTYRLRPDLPATDAELSRRWRLLINEKVEVDL